MSYSTVDFSRVSYSTVECSRVSYPTDTVIPASRDSQLSINWVGLTKPLTTSLNPTYKHSSHLRKPNKGIGRGEVGITGYQPTIDAW